MINKNPFTAILKNPFIPVNIFKLLIDYILDYEKIEVFKVNNVSVINVLEENVLVFEIKILLYFL